MVSVSQGLQGLLGVLYRGHRLLGDMHTSIRTCYPDMCTSLRRSSV